MPKIGVKLFPYTYYTLMPYLLSEISVTGRNEFWQNRLLLGTGLRVMPFRKFSAGVSGILIRSMRFYVEGKWNVCYLKDIPSSDIPSYDIILGLNISINRW